jgi:hypothetical protein
VIDAYRARMMPYSISLRRVHGKKHPRENSAKDVGLRVPAGSHGPFAVYKDGRVPLCSCHGEPWPCLEAEQQAYAEQELAVAERAMRVMPGCCPACEEPVTSRQKSITFGGPNVVNPLAEGPTFHLRRKCRGSAARYEEKWVTAEPGRPRSLLTLTCVGHLIVHHDGTGQCVSRNDGSECPTIYARHPSYSACYLSTHGCPTCPEDRRGHPGTRVSGYPKDPRAVTRIEST